MNGFRSTTCAFLAFGVGIAWSQAPLRPHLTPGTNVTYFVSSLDTEFTGAGTTKGKVHRPLRTPIRMAVTSNNGHAAMVEVTEGPWQIAGRQIGRPRIHQIPVDAGGSEKGAAPAYFSIPFPTGGAKVGQTWRSGLYGPSPLPGGLTATYQFKSVQGPYAKIAMSIDAERSCHIVGSGEFYVRLADGYIDHGKAKFDISYLRPDMKDKTKMNINSHDVQVCTVDQR